MHTNPAILMLLVSGGGSTLFIREVQFGGQSTSQTLKISSMFFVNLIGKSFVISDKILEVPIHSLDLTLGY